MRPVLRRPSSVSTATTLDRHPKSLLQSRRFIRSSASSRSSAENGTGRAAGECSYEPMNVYECVHTDWGLYTLHHHMYGEQLLDSSPYDELQVRPSTIERPFQIYLTPRTTRIKRRRSNDTQVPLWTAENPPVLTNHPQNGAPARRGSV